MLGKPEYWQVASLSSLFGLHALPTAPRGHCTQRLWCRPGKAYDASSATAMSKSRLWCEQTDILQTFLTFEQAVWLAWYEDS